MDDAARLRVDASLSVSIPFMQSLPSTSSATTNSVAA